MYGVCVVMVCEWYNECIVIVPCLFGERLVSLNYVLGKCVVVV